MIRKGAIHRSFRPAAIGLAYFVAAGATITLTRFDGGVANLWLATAVLMAELSCCGRRDWPSTIIACSIGSFLATGLLGFGWAAAAPLAIVNMAEGVMGALIIHRSIRNLSYLNSIEGLASFVLIGCMLPTAISSLGAAIVANQITGMGLTTEWLAWFAGHMLGTITFAPIVALILNGDVVRAVRAARPRAMLETAALQGMLAAVTLIVFAQDTLPLMFLPVLPLIVVTFRLDRIGTATGIVIIAVIGGVATAAGHGPISMIDAANRVHAQVFQLYLAVTLLTVLPVSAELAKRKDVLRRLRESEARYKLITESSTDMIITLDAQGIVRYASPSVQEITGFAPEGLVGNRPDDLINGPDARAVRVAFAEVLRNPATTSTVEYRAMTASGDYKWFESHTRGMLNEAGEPSGWVTAIRDISPRKSLELRLAHAATTDSLTGLANRRSFDALLERTIAERRKGAKGGCVAIFDIDLFKRVNDEYGHAVGDMVLETFARAALRVLRAGDHIARLGGEEFGLILGGASIEQASAICERLRRTIAREETHPPGVAPIAITVSAGIAEIDGATTRLQIMRAADAALYRAKAGGRDQLAIAA